MGQFRICLANGRVASALALTSAALLQIAAAEAGTERTVYSFCSQQNCVDGRVPLAGLVNVHGLLYGTTSSGGANGSGTVFQVNPTTGAEKVLHSFCSEQDCADGLDPVAGLISVRGQLFGTTQSGGVTDGAGTVFSVDPKTGAETVVHAFEGLAGGDAPYAGVINVNGDLYGTTENGGGGGGTVFSVSPTTGIETVVFSFRSPDEGQNPTAGLIDVGGALYGTTQQGGANRCGIPGCGTVFSVDRRTGAETVLHAFEDTTTDGQSPTAGLINVGGTLYGTTPVGGPYGRGYGGTVFSVNPRTGKETLVYSFCSQQCKDGQGPLAGLINVHGVLYGTTSAGGSNNHGTVFSLDPKTGAETVVYSFCGLQNCADGQNPAAGLLNVGGVLYGTTRGSLPNGPGTVFAVTP